MNALITSALTFLLFLSGCASTPKNQILQNMTIGAAAGVLIAQSKEQSKMSYSLMYGGLGASAGTLYSLYKNDPDLEVEKFKNQTASLRRQLDEITNPVLEKQLPGTLSGKVPDKYRNLIEPGEWRIYSINQWIEDGENRLIHQDKVMELIPPSLKPVALPNQNTNGVQK
jgi:hypothetical protein